jgi:hypothetical protein
MKKRLYHLPAVSLILMSLMACHPEKTGEHGSFIPVPQLRGDWWQLTTTYPDISPYEYTPGDNKVCDFTIFRAADSSWQCIACVRGNTYPGSHRFLYRWQAEHLTDSLWQPMGVFQSTGTDVEKPDGFGFTLDTAVYSAIGLLQAPHCVQHDGKYYLFYNNRGARCKISDDGLHWTDLKNDAGDYKFFDMGRDLMVFDDTPYSGKWIAYYTSGNKMPQYMAARTCSTLTGTWSEEKMVYDGWSNSRSPIYPNEFAESPFVVRYKDKYYLFAQLHVFVSDDPLDFTANHKVAVLESCDYRKRVWAPEIIQYGGEYYLAAYRPSGLWMSRMAWGEEEVSGDR